ncbi:MAG: ACT domain-containing protein, partial [Euryarchaeota archaeon]|nr:ACT domain-containing protein [Euryarchaeota archaeon]
STAAVVRDYIDTHPSIKDCLTDGLINLSALSRRIVDERELEKPEAVLVACRRYEQEAAKKETPHLERRLRATLAKSRVEIASRVAIVTLRADWKIYRRFEMFLRDSLAEGQLPKLIQGSRAITFITDGRTAEAMRKEIEPENLIDIQKDLVEISVASPESIRTTPGVMSFLYGSLSSNGINVLETMSTYTDTIFIVESQDMMRSFEILSRCLESE